MTATETPLSGQPTQTDLPCNNTFSPVDVPEPSPTPPKKDDIRSQVTQRIIDAIEQGVPPWRKGWTTQPHFNAATGKRYRGINQFLLAIALYYTPEDNDPRWMTFQQAKAKGLKIKKGAKSTQLVRLVKIEKSVPKKQENEDEVEEEVMAPGKNGFWVMKRFNVFNGNQIDGLEPLPVTEKNEVASIAAVDAIAERMKATGLKTIHGGNIAAYGEKLDVVFMPDRSSFQNSEDYYATLLHELAHATGAEKRLKRFLANARFGSSQYAREELVAEISAAMMCAELGMAISPTHIENHASYVASWLKCLKADKNAIFVAASAAEHVCQYLREQAPTEMPEVDSVEVAESLAA